MSSHFSINDKDPRRNPRKPTVPSGFTLLELMVVLVIIGLLAGLVTEKTRSYLIVSKQNAAKVEIAKIIEALEAFYAIHSRYPTNEEGLVPLVEKSDSFPDGLLSKIPKDPWKNDYVYNCPGRNAPFEVICYGADGREGGDGENQDIRSGQDDTT